MDNVQRNYSKSKKSSAADNLDSLIFFLEHSFYLKQSLRKKAHYLETPDFLRE